MKIAFIGTHGTGKTTLAYDVAGVLKKKGYDVEVVTSIARSSPFPINENSTEKSQLWISLSMINKELEIQKTCEHIVCARSILDAYAYTLNILNNSQFFKNLFEYWIKTYDILIYTPIRYKLEKDFVRSDNKEFQIKIDNIIKKILNENNIKFSELPEQDSINFVVKLFEDKLKKE